MVAETMNNIADALMAQAAQQPERIAMRVPGRDGAYAQSLTYGELDSRSTAIAHGLAARGVAAGQRAVVMVRPTPDFFLLMFALFKRGAVPVLVDPGIDKRALKQCLAEAQPHAFIGIPLAMLASKLLGWAKAARLRISTGRYALLADTTLAQVEADGRDVTTPLPPTDPDSTAAILFTSGSTGVPKGVVYRHRHFIAQLHMLRDAFGIAPGGVDLPTFPPFALFDPGLGLTSIIPDMDPTRPARANPVKLHKAIERFGVTQLFGSPALMRVLAEYGKPLPTVQRVTSAGAPVPSQVVARMQELLPADAQFWTPYGATECLPVAVIEGRELIRLRARTEAGAGTCVGKPVAPNEVRIIAITDAPIADWTQAQEVPQGVVGEITVAGPSATDSYFNRDAANAAGKIVESRDSGFTDIKPVVERSGTRTAIRVDAKAEAVDSGRLDASSDAAQTSRIVHRMGDLGYFDGEGRLWFCGRKSQRVVVDAHTTLATEQIEPVFNTHPDVARSALVGIGPAGAQTPVLCVELAAGSSSSDWPRIHAELRTLADGLVHTAKVQRFLRYPASFPVDIRHNAKIGREKLGRWAAKQPCERDANV